MGGFLGLDQDRFGEMNADSEAGVAHLANDISVTAEKFDPLFFAEA